MIKLQLFSLINRGIGIICETIWFPHVPTFLSYHVLNLTLFIRSFNERIPYIVMFNAWLVNLIPMRLW